VAVNRYHNKYKRRLHCKKEETIMIDATREHLTVKKIIPQIQKMVPVITQLFTAVVNNLKELTIIYISSIF
jgi:hypothetical protein